MVLLCPRIHFYEINDQSWCEASPPYFKSGFVDSIRFPPYFRAKVQDALTLMWTLDLPIIRSCSPAALVATTLQCVLQNNIFDYTYIDFCAGAGGPTPFIEKELNVRMRKDHIITRSAKDTDRMYNAEGGVNFVLTDIAPHLEAWRAAARKSENLHYIATSVDAADAPRDLLKPFQKKDSIFEVSQKMFRLFNLAFHHFDDHLASKILQNTLATSDGFGIFELQGRTFSSLITCSLMWPLLWIVSPYYFWRSPGHLFFTYIIPIIPFVVVFDGYVSSLRTRTGDEILAMLERKDPVAEWDFWMGNEFHTFPIGEMSYFIGLKRN